jgi:hypothetical protein
MGSLECKNLVGFSDRNPFDEIDLRIRIVIRDDRLPSRCVLIPHSDEPIGHLVSLDCDRRLIRWPRRPIHGQPKQQRRQRCENQLHKSPAFYESAYRMSARAAPVGVTWARSDPKRLINASWQKRRCQVLRESLLDAALTEIGTLCGFDIENRGRRAVDDPFERLIKVPGVQRSTLTRLADQFIAPQKQQATSTR